ncbi:hypothetical protein TeGR_g7585 [Tetraparma gracilis]|uniref:WD40 repeat-like protein n=1 Tax=Tetraparma gracilis TaxID=2962635 RepID=A0ABQ6ND56_9STRA|nr:hypothetical protein TeGR_g7585 [Tetraparma gracilis]
MRVWDSTTGAELLTIAAHKTSAAVVLPHPTDPTLLVTGGADGVAYLWDLKTGEALMRHENAFLHGMTLEEPSQFREYSPDTLVGYLDGAWSPDGMSVTLTDDAGRFVLFDTFVDRALQKRGEEEKEALAKLVANPDFGPDAKDWYKCRADAILDLPSEKWAECQYFSTDYHELLYDVHGYAIDKASGLPPHLAPRGGRVNHVAVAAPDLPHQAFDNVAGPLPLPPSTASELRRTAHSLDVTRRALLFSPPSLNKRGGEQGLVFGSHPIIVAAGVNSSFLKRLQDGLSDEDNIRRGGGGFTVRGATSTSTTSTSAASASRQLSSAYHWRDANEEDEEEMRRQESRRSSGRTGRQGSSTRPARFRQPPTRTSTRGMGDGTDDEDNDFVAGAYDDDDDDDDEEEGVYDDYGGGGVGGRSSRHRRAQRRDTYAVQPTRVSERSLGVPRAHYTADLEDSDVDMEDAVLASRSQQYSGRVSYRNFVGANETIDRAWLLRSNQRWPSDGSGDLGNQFYCPQVGDSVVYIPALHVDHYTNTQTEGTTPWLQWKGEGVDELPVIRCNVASIK